MSASDLAGSATIDHTSKRRQLLIALSCAYGCAIGVMTNTTFPYVFSLLLEPVSSEFGWGRATFAAGLAISTFAGAVGIPIAGRLMDRFGVRPVLAPGIVVLGLCTMSMALIDGSLPLLYALFAVLGALGAFGALVGYAKLISAWFHERRGLVLGLALGGGVGVGGISAPWVAGALLENYGWRGTYIGLGLILIIFGTPNALLLKEPHRSSGGRSHTAGLQIGLSTREAVRTGTFWLLIAVILLSTIAAAGSVIHLAPLLGDRGLPQATVMIALSALAACNTLGKVVTGYALDRIQTPRVGLPLFALVLVGLLVLAYGPPSLAVVGAALLGFGVGAEIDMIAYFVARYFGVRSYAELFGYTYAATGIAFGIGPLVMGGLYDKTGSYAQPLLVLQISLAISLVLIALLKPYVFDVRPPMES
jgi:MFS family permease